MRNSNHLESRLVFLLLFVPALVCAQEIPRDTSFTTFSAWKKIQKNYPSAVPVVAQLPAGVQANENVVYASHGERNLHLDLFSPIDSLRGPYPAVLLIHGGGWRSGHREMEFPMAQYLAAHGYITATVEYRLSIESRYPAGVHDLKAAIRWMRAHALEYNIDAKKIAVYGCSSGGQMAALLGTTGEIPAFEGSNGNTQLSSAVQAIVDIDGILDFTQPAESGKDTGSAKPSAAKYWFGASYKDDPRLWKEASPLNHVSERTPPILFVNSSLDRFHVGRDEMIEKLKMFGIYAEVQTLPDTPHPFWLFHPWFEEASGHVLKFLDKTLKK